MAKKKKKVYVPAHLKHKPGKKKGPKTVSVRPHYKNV